MVFTIKYTKRQGVQYSSSRDNTPWKNVSFFNSYSRKRRTTAKWWFGLRFRFLASRCGGLMLAVGRTFDQTQAAAASGFLCSRVFSFLDARAYFTRPWIDIVQSYLPYERERERVCVRVRDQTSLSPSLSAMHSNDLCKTYCNSAEIP